MGAKPANENADALRARQRKLAKALSTRLDADGEARLDGTADSLERLDMVLIRERESIDAANRDRLAELVGAYTGEVLLRESPGRWVLDVDELPAVELVERARIRVTRRAQRLLCGEAGGMATLYARVKATATQPLPRTQPSTPPLGADRPLGLRRSAFRDVDAEGDSEQPGPRSSAVGDPDVEADSEPLDRSRSGFHDSDTGSDSGHSTSEAVVFTRLAAGAERHTRSSGFGPSPFVWFLILCLAALIAWAAYTYRNAPP